MTPAATSEFEDCLNKAQALARSNRPIEALECASRALALRPADPWSGVIYGQCLVAVGRRAEAYKLAIGLVAEQIDQPSWNDALGTLLTYCEDPKRALPLFTRAVTMEPGRSKYLYNLAAAQRMIGDLDGAVQTLERLIAVAPEDAQAYCMRADLRTQTAVSNHVAELRRLLHEKQPLHSEIMLCFALGKELEDLGSWDECFSWLKRGCELQRGLLRYDVQDDVRTIERIIELHDAGFVESGTGVESDAPICVMGLPRSGTTLVEQILGSHSAVRSAGELQAFPVATVKAVQRLGGHAVGKHEFVQRIREVDPKELGEAYLGLAGWRSKSGSHFVDKQPLNYLYAGVISRALPNARLIILAREPTDTCYAMYKTLFTNSYPFTYDLIDLAHYYVAWHGLIRHWQAVLGERLLTVQYEDLVANQETVTRRILAHCGLPWEAACLQFHTRERVVTTASAVQVRRPLNADSVGRWRHFQLQLMPLTAHLRGCEPAGGWRLVSTTAH
jgi:tetratricopeptide (TPR) repeat protein